MDIFKKRAELRTRAGFTLVEILVTCTILVIAFALMAIIFGKVMTVRNAIHSSSNAENLAAYLMDTILYGPAVRDAGGIVNYGLLNTTQNSITDSLASQPSATATFTVANSVTPPAEINIVFNFNPGVLYGNTLTGTWDNAINPLDPRDLRPSWAIDKRLQVYYNAADAAHTSGFWFYMGDDSTPASNPSTIRWVAIRITVITEGQQSNEGATIWRYVRLKNQPPI